MNILYYDCFSGISGDMNLGAMIDLGIDPDTLREQIMKVIDNGWELEVTSDNRHGIWGTRVTVKCSEQGISHRHYSDIKQLIDKSDLTNNVKTLSKSIFHKIAEAEAKVHKVDIDKVHFHEVGAIDSIVDVVGAAICYDLLNIDKVIVSTIEVGSGTVKCDHGILPVPAPATAEIVSGIPISKGGVNFEATTPTGAAIVAALGDEFGEPAELTIKSTGYGIGQKENPDRPNILRVHLAEPPVSEQKGTGALVIECNIDDMNPELYDNLFSRLFQAGASDVFLTPIIMKKGRPANILSVICYPEIRDKVTDILFTESTTLGIRSTKVEKTMLEREFRTITTPFGKIQVKCSIYKGRILSAKAESDRLKAIAAKENVTLREVQKIVNRIIDSEVYES